MNRLARRAIATASMSLRPPASVLLRARRRPMRSPSGQQLRDRDHVLAERLRKLLTLTDVTADPWHRHHRWRQNRLHADASYRGTDVLTIPSRMPSACCDATVSIIVNDPPVALDDPGLPCGNLGSLRWVLPGPRGLSARDWPRQRLVRRCSGPCGLLANDTDPNGRSTHLRDPHTSRPMARPMKIDESFFALQTGSRMGHPRRATCPGVIVGLGLASPTAPSTGPGSYSSAGHDAAYWVAQINDVAERSPPATAMVIVRGRESGSTAASGRRTSTRAPNEDRPDRCSFELGWAGAAPAAVRPSRRCVSFIDHAG